MVSGYEDYCLHLDGGLGGRGYIRVFWAAREGSPMEPREASVDAGTCHHRTRSVQPAGVVCTKRCWDCYLEPDPPPQAFLARFSPASDGDELIGVAGWRLTP